MNVTRTTKTSAGTSDIETSRSTVFQALAAELRWWWFTPIAGAALLSGCAAEDGKAKVFPVKGQVNYQGEAATGAFVVFHPKGNAAGEGLVRPSGQVKGDGSFQLSTFDVNDGAPPGEYAVTVEWRKLIVEGKDAQAGPNVIPTQYTRPETTPLSITVAAAPNDLAPLEITGKPPRAGSRRTFADE